MTNTKNITGGARAIANTLIRLVVFFFFVKELFKGRLQLRRFFPTLRRLNFFLSKLSENKAVKMGKRVRLGLYIPGAPSKAFETAAKKFAVFGEKLPCATALISITSACRFKCEHCYQKLDKGKDVSISKLKEAIKKIQNRGVAFFNIEGGEPFIVYDRLKSVCETIDERSEIWINTTGDGMSVKRLEELKSLGLTACMFPLLSANEEDVNRFMGSANAWEIIQNGISMCHQAQIFVAFNMCLQKEDFRNGTFERCLEKAKQDRVAYIQIIKPKPAGGWLGASDTQFSKEDLALVQEKVLLYNQDKRFRDYPAISAQTMEEDRKMFGCTAGGTDRFYLNAKGDVQACEFLNLSFGNIAKEDINIILDRMRNVFRTPGNCWFCEEYSDVISKTMKQHNLESLPLSPELSKEIWENFKTTETTPLYDIIENKIR